MDSDIAYAISAICLCVAVLFFMIAARRWWRARRQRREYYWTVNESPPTATEIPRWLDGSRQSAQPSSLYVPSLTAGSRKIIEELEGVPGLEPPKSASWGRCPECGQKFGPPVSQCPTCAVGLVFPSKYTVRTLSAAPYDPYK